MKEIIRNLIKKVIIPKHGNIEYNVVYDSDAPKYVLVIYKFPVGRPKKLIFDDLISDTEMLLKMLDLKDIDTVEVGYKMVVIRGRID